MGHPRLAGEFVAGVRGESSAMAGFAAGLLPLAPGLAQQIWGGLGLSGNVADVAWTDIIAGVSVPLAHGDLGETCTLALPTSRPETGTWQASKVGVAK